MWIFTRYGFFSIASARKQGGDGEIDPNEMMIRARSKQHLNTLKERFGLAASIVENTQTDYRYRLVAPKSTVVRIVSELVLEQEWSNFKNEAARMERSSGSSHKYVDALHKVWGIMHEVQVAELKREQPRKR